jgi:starch phosphorylase
VAYFSMEIALEPAIPTYSGGLGVLAGDTIRSCADLGIPMVAVTLVHRRGYFRQRLGPQGQQTEEPDIWAPKEHAEPLPAQVSVGIEGRPVQIAGWRYWVQGANGAPVPVLLLDTDLPENSPADRRLTDALYSGDERHRLCQETILGIGGIRMLRALGHADIERFHLNEGHAALVAVELLEEGGADVPPEPAPLAQQIESLRARCVFTTHTPVPAGHDRFSLDLAQKVLGEGRCRWIEALGIRTALNMTELALASAAFVNGVAMRHGEVSRSMFPDYPIRSITNGIHAPTWASPSFRALFDRHIPGWRTDPLSLRYGVKIPLREIAWAHNRAKQVLLQRVNEGSSDRFEPNVFTIGFARRVTAYKRAALFFRDLDRLVAISDRIGPLQIVLAGKAHPKDQEGKAMLREIFRARDQLRGRIAVAYLENYEMDLARVLCSGADLWLNTPVPPLEASGTSGMKAALNGVPSLSTMDGWWVEGCVPGVTGWAIGEDDGPDPEGRDRDDRDAQALMAVLAEEILPCFYRDRDRYLTIMRSAIALNASFFNTQRMALQYLYEAYMNGRGEVSGTP